MSDLTQYTQGYDPATDPDFNNNGDFKPLPPGDYSVVVSQQPELKETKKKREGISQRGLFMSIAFKVTSPEHSGRLLFANINLDNDNQMCVDIGKRKLAKLGMAIGLPTAPERTEQLVNAQLIVKVKVDGDRNQITDYNPIGQQRPAAAPVQQQQAIPQQQQQQQQAPASTGPMPWQTEQGQAETVDDDNIPF